MIEAQFVKWPHSPRKPWRTNARDAVAELGQRQAFAVAAHALQLDG